jgi:hypothetical protein
MISLVASVGCSASDHKDASPATQTATATGPGVHGPIRAEIDERAHVGVAGLVPATGVWRLSSSQPVDGPIAVRLPLLRAPRSNEVVVGLTAERRTGPWVPVAARLDSSGRTVVLSTTHFSWFSGLFANVEDAIRTLKDNIVDGLTSNAFAEARPPRCAEESRARTEGYSITSDSKDTVYWCFGIEGNRRILRVVDRRRYPLSVGHQGLTTLTQGHWNGLATLSRVASGQRAVIAPSESVTFRVDARDGSHALLRTEFDGFGQSLYQLQVGVQTALELLTAFGFRSATAAVEASARLAGITNCATALENPPDVGALIRKCFSVRNLIEAFGTRALLIAPIMLASTFIEFFRSEFNALGDQLNRRDRYAIRIATVRAQPISPTDLYSAPVPSLCGHQPGTLVNGELPGIPAVEGAVALDEDIPIALGDLDSNGVADAAAVFNCNQGGVGWPHWIVFYAPGPRVLGAFDMNQVVGGARGATTEMTYEDGAIHIESLDARPGDPGCCPSGQASIVLRWNGSTIVASDVQHR